MPRPLTAGPEADAPEGVGAVIGPEGGEVVFEEDGVRVRVSVPSGALETASRLTIRPHGATVAGAVGPVVDLGPDGTQFAKPVTVFMSQPAPVLGEAIVNTLQVATLGADGWEALTPVPADSGEVAGLTEHFSVFGLVAAAEGNLSVLGESSGQSFQDGPVSLRSSEAVRLSSMAVASTFVSFGLSAPEARTVELTVGGLRPQVEVFLYEPPSLLPTRWSADAAGEVVFSTDLGPAPRTFWLQAAQGTLKIDGAFPDGGDCALVGVFDPATSMCTLTSDVANNLELNSAGLTLDCDGHTIAPTAAVPAVRLSFNDSAVTGCRVEASATGVLVNFGVSGARIVNNTIVNHANAAPAVHLNLAGFNAVVEGNTIEAAEGLFLQETGGASISNNRVQATVAIRGLSSLTAFNLIDHNTLVNVDFPGAGFLRGVHLEAAAWNTVADNALDGRAVGQRLDLAGISIAQVGYSTLVGNTIEGYDKGVVLGATDGMEVAFNALSDNGTALAITALIPPWASPPRITFNDFVNNGPPQLTSASDLDLTDPLDVPGSPTFGKGNYWGHDCAAPALFVPGLDANTASSGAPVAVADSNPFGAPVAHLDRTDTAALAALIPPACPDPTNHPPVLAQPFAPLDLNEDALPVTIVLTEHLTDPDPADLLTFVAASSQPNILQVEVVGTALTLTPQPNQHGTAEVLIRATDLAGAHTEALLTLTLHPVNDAPTLLLPVPPLIVAEDAPTTTLDLTARAHDVDVATDADVLTWHLIANTAPLLIRADLLGDALHLTPEPDQHGLATITLRVTDLAGLTADLDVQVTLEPVNDPPFVLSPIPPVFVDEDAAPVVFDLSAVFDDPDMDDLLTVHLAANANPAMQASVLGELLYLVPHPDANGQGPLTLRATDRAGATVDLDVPTTVQPVNDAPVGIPLTHQVVGGSPAELLLIGWDLETCELDFEVVQGPAHGTVEPPASIACDPLGFDLATLNYLAEPGYVGWDTVVFTVHDGELTSEPVTLHIEVHGNVQLVLETVLPDGFDPAQTVLKGGQGKTLEGFERMQADLARIEAKLRPSCGGAGQERSEVVAGDLGKVTLVDTLQNGSRSPIAGLNIPDGCLTELRLITREATVRIHGEDVPLIIPSGMQTGIKVRIGEGGIQLVPGVQRELVGVLDLLGSLVWNRQGLRLVPPVIDLHPAPLFDCGDGVCTGPIETCASCASDCGSCCGDGVCSAASNETCWTCASDCCLDTCGDGVCDPGEACLCPDCPATNCACGDGVCDGDAGESCATCGADCGVCEPLRCDGLGPAPARVPVDDASATGSLNGGFTISQRGSATYTIPLAVPPGRAGMAPSLALVYDSDGGDGIAGKGFSLAGLSTIHRCSQNLALDDRVAGIEPYGNVFCLDGKRLVEIGAYAGAANAIEYRTMQETFVRVVGYGERTAPTSWTVWHRGGAISTYGDTAQSRETFDLPDNGGEATLQWALSKRADRYGNDVRFGYEQAWGDFSLRIKQIDYTGGPAQAPERHVDFVYEPRPDVRGGYVWGVPHPLRERLSAVKAFGPEHDLAVEYRLAYLDPPQTARSLLHQVRECAPSGACRPATSFDWEQPTVVYTNINASSAICPNGSGCHYDQAALRSTVVLDANGDGYRDLMFRHNLGWWLSLGGLTGPGAAIQTSTSNPTLYTHIPASGNGQYGNPPTPSSQEPIEVYLSANDRIIPADLNGDGRDDLIMFGQSLAGQHVTTEFYWQALLSQGDGTFEWRHLTQAGQPIERTALAPMTHVVDLNGDGLSDLVYGQGLASPWELSGDGRGLVPVPHCFNDPTATWQVRLNLGDGAFSAPVDTGIRHGCFAAVLSLDVDGDGVDELLVRDTWWGDFYVVLDIRVLHGVVDVATTLTAIALPHGGEMTQVYSDTTSDEFKLLDVNADGVMDILHFDSEEGRLSVNRNQSGLPQSPSFSGSAHNPMTPEWGEYELFDQSFVQSRVSDIDRDGIQDLMMPLRHVPSGEVHIVALIAPDPYSPFVLSPLPYRYDGLGSLTVDINQDQVVDVFYHTPEVIWLPTTPPSYLEVQQTPQSPISLLSSTEESVGTYHISAFTNGRGERTEVTYDHLRQGSSFYETTTASRPCMLPERCVPTGASVVVQVDVVGPDGVDTNVQQTYRQWKTHVSSQQALGFERIERFQSWADRGSDVTWTSTTFDNRLIWLGNLPVSLGFRPVEAESVVMVDAERAITHRQQTLWTPVDLDHGGVHTVAIHPVRTTSRQLESAGGGPETLIRTMETHQNFNVLGQLVDRSTSVIDPDSRDTFQTFERIDYLTDTDAWLIAQPIRRESQDNSIIDGRITFAPQLVSTYERDPTTGDVRVAHVGTSTETVDTFFAHDALGHILEARSRAPGETDRVLRYGYDDEGVFATCAENALGHRSTLQVDRTTGAVTATRDANGVISRQLIDQFARPVELIPADGFTSLYTYAVAWTSPGVQHQTIRVDKASGAVAEAELDHRGQVIRSSHQGFDGRWVDVSYDYDRTGNLVVQSLPTWRGTSAERAFEARYDLLGRVTRSHTQGEDYLNFAYDGRTVTTTWGELSNRSARTATFDARGLPLQVLDADGGATHYGYDPRGALESIVDDHGNTTHFDRDDFGRVVAYDDPDRGHHSATYNLYGETLTTTDAASQQTTRTYDALGRPLSLQTSEGTTTWTWDEGLGGIGRLTSVDTASVQRVYSYTPIGQLATETLLVDGEPMTMRYDYDDVGRVSELHYPVHEGAPFSVVHHYNSHGYLDRLTDGRDPTTAFWHPLSLDAFDRVDLVELGNDAIHTRRFDGLQMVGSHVEHGAEVLQDLEWVHDGIGHLIQRVDHVEALTENFGYDGLDRLDSWERLDGAYTGAVLDHETFTYDTIGNMTSRSSVGGYTFDGPTGGPHALATAGADSFTYDANGNVLAGRGRTYAYDALGLPSAIVHETETQYLYSGDLQRVRKTERLAADATETTCSLGELYKRRVRDIGGAVSVESRYAIFALDGLVAEVHVDASGQKVRYVAADHLGSVTLEMTETGQVHNRFSYGPFGTQTATGGAGVGQSSVERSFTGHDSDLATGLVDMKFRQYDPDLGMFLSPDPLRGDAFDPANLNPYMYAHNQPTKWVDPWGLQDSGSGNAGTSSETWNFPPTLICAGGCLAAEAWSEVGEISDAEGSSGSEPNTVSDTESSAVDWFIDAAAGTTCAASPHCVAYTAADDFYTDARWFSSTEETRTLDAIWDRVPLKDYGEGLGRTAGAIYLGDPDAALEEGVKTAGAYFETATFVVTVGEGAGAARKLLSGAGSGAVRLAQVGRAKVGCFVAGTEVLLCDGTTVPIESLQVGDEVQAFDHDTGQWVCAPVLATSVRQVDVVVDLEVDPDGAGPLAAFTLTGTLEHPFFVPVRGEYVPMAELRAGDGLRREDGGEAVVVGVEVRAVRVEVFNLEVGGVHDYCVSREGANTSAVLVHNGLGDCLDEIFEIMSGVRRAKAADIVQNSPTGTIPAVIRRDGQPDQFVPDLKISQLRSPKSTIDYDSRFRDNNLAPTRSGSVPPHIEVSPLSGERSNLIPVRDIKFNFKRPGG